MEVTDQEFACGKEYEGEYRWTARDRVIARREHLDRSESQKVGVEELELLLGPEDPQLDLRFILVNARRKKGRRIFEILSSKGPRVLGSQQSAMGRAPKDAGDTGGRVKKEGARSGLWSQSKLGSSLPIRLQEGS